MAAEVIMAVLTPADFAGTLGAGASSSVGHAAGNHFYASIRHDIS